LINALFLLNRLRTGSIIIDGIDTATIPLKRLRSSLAIIPQDPVIFSGTIRDNLDPLNQFDDDKLWTALKQCGIYDAIDPAVGLQMPVSEGGENWSTGQRQLICLARALLKQTHVLVLDEATASVDMATDALIQRTLRQQFAKTTIITIAHRLNTIMDYDKIVVMDRGVISEVGSPSELIAKNGGLFASMVNGSS
jgi:ATP-binding cassette subfamily C (CFTR/MRP) protein 1